MMDIVNELPRSVILFHPLLYTAALPFPFTTILRPAVASRRSRVAVAVLSSGK
jgi:hypothetical protein